jgi:hypothetical protein
MNSFFLLLIQKCVCFHFISKSWEGNELRISDCEGNLLKDGITLEGGSEGSQDICLTATKFEVQCGGGGFSQEVSWEIVYDAFNVVVLSGGETKNDEVISNCPSCSQKGGQNITIYVYGAHVQDGGEWWEPASDAYAKVEANGIEDMTSVKYDTNDPTWKKYLKLGCVLPGDMVKVMVYDEDLAVGGQDDLMIYNEWTDWDSWPQGRIKRLNDTLSSNSKAYHKEYYVEVAYFLGDFFTWEPSLPPVPRPTR